MSSKSFNNRKSNNRNDGVGTHKSGKSNSGHMINKHTPVNNPVPGDKGGKKGK